MLAAHVLSLEDDMAEHSYLEDETLVTKFQPATRDPRGTQRK